MAESLMNKDELMNLNERYKVTKELVNKQLGALLERDLTGNTLALLEVINIIRLKDSSERLEEMSKRLENSSKRLENKSLQLNILTLALIVLTAVLLSFTILMANH